MWSHKDREGAHVILRLEAQGVGHGPVAHGGEVGIGEWHSCPLRKASMGILGYPKLSKGHFGGEM